MNAGKSGTLTLQGRGARLCILSDASEALFLSGPDRVIGNPY
ncbi:hypothetical protein J2Z22_001454 [Paenibacillus forsythiae]|uniref:Uncharacterized protein n=1 Tax=Paenibacillus forsythiae TaxID=365616 RepID=A0ABU3H528_9BACL|nr:hypothetical protein [Paenibacillus forsythiae]MDT3425934.1 hypothetical protein [Paenibacillus forsythiae]